MRIRLIQRDDLPLLTQLYRETALVMGPQLYSRAQVQAWASSVDDVERFERFLFEPTTWVAEDDAGMLGFVGLDADGHIASLYVRHDRTRQGVGSTLLQHAMAQAHQRGLRHLFAEASSLSKPVFERHGFFVHHVEHVTHKGVAFSRPVMHCTLNGDGPMKSEPHEQMARRFVAGGMALRSAVNGITPEQWHAKPGPGKWSAHELVIHLQDSDAIAIDRMKRVLAEDEPTFFGADESRYVERLHCEAQSAEDAVELFDVGRRQFARVLAQLSEEEFARKGTHNEAGELTVADLLRIYTEHLEYHLDFLRQKLERLREEQGE